MTFFCELSAWQMIHMKCQVLFSMKKKIKLLSAAVVISTLTLVLLNPDIPCICSVDPDQLASDQLI